MENKTRAAGELKTEQNKHVVTVYLVENRVKCTPPFIQLSVIVTVSFVLVYDKFTDVLLAVKID